jgi:NAD(P)H-dependent FMN reductase
LLRWLAERAPASVTIEIFHELERIPPFNPDDENKPPPETVVNWRTRLKEADALIVSTPEYAHGVPGVLKNALDWIVGLERSMRRKRLS